MWLCSENCEKNTICSTNIYWAPTMWKWKKLISQSMKEMGNSVQFSRSVMSNSLTPWIAARQAPLSITNSWSSPRLTSINGHNLLLIHSLPLSIVIQATPFPHTFCMTPHYIRLQNWSVTGTDSKELNSNPDSATNVLGDQRQVPLLLWVKVSR